MTPERNAARRVMEGNGDNLQFMVENAVATRVALYNAMISRAQRWNRLTDGDRRDVARECGHPTGPQTAQFYQDLYDESGIAARVVEFFPKECWQVQPMLYESEDAKTTTPFEAAFAKMCRDLGGPYNFFQDELGNLFWEYLYRADIVSGIGHYGVILLGLEGDGPLSTPIPFVDPEAPPSTTTNLRKLLFMRVLPETLVQINSTDGDPSSPRYGQPLEYSVTFSDPNYPSTYVGQANTTEKVHWSRVVHIADGVIGNEVSVDPRLKQVKTHILDLVKLYGGSAEMYWQGAMPGWAFTGHPNLGTDVDMDSSGIKDEMEQYMTRLQRYIAIVGADVKSLAPQVVDPSPQIDKQIEAICIRKGYPKRTFMGAESGELASGQDDANWTDRVRARQNLYLTPRLICPVVNRLIAVGVLPIPKGYSVWWPDVTSQSGIEKANVALIRTQALVQYANSKASDVMGRLEFLVSMLGFTESESVRYLENAGIDRLEIEKERIEFYKNRVSQGMVPDPKATKPKLPGGEDNTPAAPSRDPAGTSNPKLRN